VLGARRGNQLALVGWYGDLFAVSPKFCCGPSLVKSPVKGAAATIATARADRAERQTGGDRLEGGGGDRDVDHWSRPDEIWVLRLQPG
jgi:hypothetical protein